MSDVSTDDQNCVTKDVDKQCTKGTNTDGIVILNATAKWTQDQSENTINDIFLTVKPGQLIVIIGSVGAGKVWITINYSLVL